MRPTVVLRLLAFVAVSIAVRIESSNQGFAAAGRRGCISASETFAGAPVVIDDCNGLPEQDWGYSTGGSTPQQLKVFGDKCLDVTDGVNADGTKLQIWDCVNGSTNQLWTVNTDGTFQWAGTNKCIDLSNGIIIKGNQLQLWTCNPDNQNQKWSGSLTAPGVKILSTVMAGHTAAKAIAASSSVNGAAVVLDDYDGRAGALPNGNRIWVPPPVGTVGQIKTFDGAQCIDVPNGDATNGNTLQVWECTTGNGNQLWTIESFGQEGKYFVRWAGAPEGVQKCMQIKDKVLANGAAVGIYDCDAADMYQSWEEDQPE